jgi:hypothetical protein
MLCQLCGKQIGLFRRVVDREFCTVTHRQEARTSLDRSLADIDEQEDDSWAVSRSRKAAARAGSPSTQTASVMLLVVAAVLILATLSFSGQGNTSFAIATAPSTRPADAGWVAGISNSVGHAFRNKAPATWHEDFHSGFNDWVRAGSRTLESSGDWSMSAEGLKPGRLRLWKRSTALANYELDFLGQIDHKSMGWAYRALDSGNFYGTKLTIMKQGPGTNAGLVRFVMLNGHEMDRVQLPLPLTLATGESYRVRVNVLGDHFITSVNGQVISSWSDQRLHRGGVGFFSDEGESATLKWVSLSERDSVLGKVLAYFSLIRMPLLEE